MDDRTHDVLKIDGGADCAREIIQDGELLDSTFEATVFFLGGETCAARRVLGSHGGELNMTGRTEPPIKVRKPVRKKQAKAEARVRSRT
ncbi:MAG TPA: hypothetical protein VL126_12625, partial [Bacteroidota bacterium]|nr:hypothetical protein [Bacteroidota bacterium]